jgi:ribosomal protein S18 acetylase RimI-like enzyme
MEFRIATTADCPLVRSLAERVWAPTYAHLMGPEQLDYMFEMMYSVENLARAMTEGGQRFLIFSHEGAHVGYIAYETLPDHHFYLQKIYLLPSGQGTGMGRAMLDALLGHLRGLDPAARRLGLNVNRHNVRAVCFYLRNGFEVVSRRDKAIGRGYFMNDYVMERDI